jgi:hypothetical protein
MDKLSFWGNSDDLAYFARNGSKLQKSYKERETDEIIEVGSWRMDPGANAVFNVGDIVYVVLTYSTHGYDNKNACWRVGVVQHEKDTQIPDNWNFEYDVYESRAGEYSMLLHIHGAKEGIEVTPINR